MANLVSVHNLMKTYGARPLFEGLAFAVTEGARIGLIGPNGAGKSTLLKILAGKTSADAGTVSFQRGLRVACLDQDPQFTPGRTVIETILEGAPGDEWVAMARAHELMSKLELTEAADGPIDVLSGGWKKRVALARELAREPDLLLLDEPTNHLDVESILWLEDFLEQARFSTIVVTHDRLFLQRVSNRILELDRRNAGGILAVDGDYSAYLETKGALMQAQERREVIMANTLRRETEWLRRGAKARQTKQQARIKRAGDLKDEVSELSTRNQVRTARLDFQGAAHNPKRLLEGKAISKSLGGKPLFTNVDLLLAPGTRVGLLGPNGCGKTTFIKTLLAELPPDTGEVIRADNVTVSWFEQNRDQLDPHETLSDTLCPRGDHVEYRGGRVHIRSYLDRFLFSQAQMDMRVGNLSGGEQSRLLVARLMLTPANLLVLDEPTNDLDLATLSVLEECLTEFPGAVLLVTHDRYFLDHVANKILAFGGPKGTLVPFADVSQWERWQVEKAAEERARASSSAKHAPSAPMPVARNKKLSFKDQRELETIEGTILKAEAELARLAAESATTEVQTSPARLTEVAKALAHAESEVARLYTRWAELTG